MVRLGVVASSVSTVFSVTLLSSSSQLVNVAATNIGSATSRNILFRSFMSLCFCQGRVIG